MGGGELGTLCNVSHHDINRPQKTTKNLNKLWVTTIVKTVPPFLAHAAKHNLFKDSLVHFLQVKMEQAHERDLINNANKKVHAAKDPLEKLRQHCLARGVKGIVALGK